MPQHRGPQSTKPDRRSNLLRLAAGDMRRMMDGPPEAAAALLGAGAEAGLPEAQALYGQVLLDGRGVEASPAEAFDWFRKAASAGHLMALNMVGRCHEKGWGTHQDPIAAVHCYRIAAERGLDWGMYNYAGALGLGAGVVKDEAAALAWFRKAAALGHAKSVNFVGGFYERGHIVRQDLDQAADCYRQAAEGGDFRGQFNHARLLAEAGRTQEAAAWFDRAAQAATPQFLTVIRSYLDQAELVRRQG